MTVTPVAAVTTASWECASIRSHDIREFNAASEVPSVNLPCTAASCHRDVHKIDASLCAAGSLIIQICGKETLKQQGNLAACKETCAAMTTMQLPTPMQEFDAC